MIELFFTYKNYGNNIFILKSIKKLFKKYEKVYIIKLGKYITKGVFNKREV